MHKSKKKKHFLKKHFLWCFLLGGVFKENMFKSNQKKNKTNVFLMVAPLLTCTYMFANLSEIV